MDRSSIALAREAGLDDRADAPWQLAQPSVRQRLALLCWSVAMPLLVVAGALLADPAHGTGLNAGTWGLITAGAVVVVVVWVAIDRIGLRRRLRLHPVALELELGRRRHPFALAELCVDEARVVDLREHTALRPRWKRHGIGFGGLRGGWFQLRNGARALVATAGGNRVLWLPTRNGHGLLLEARSAQALLDRLRRMAAATG